MSASLRVFPQHVERQLWITEDRVSCLFFFLLLLFFNLLQPAVQTLYLMAVGLDRLRCTTMRADSRETAPALPGPSACLLLHPERMGKSKLNSNCIV